MHVAPPSVDQWQSLGLVAWLHLNRNRLAVLAGTWWRAERVLFCYINCFFNWSGNYPTHMETEVQHGRRRTCSGKGEVFKNNTLGEFLPSASLKICVVWSLRRIRRYNCILLTLRVHPNPFIFTQAPTWSKVELLC